VLTWEEFAASVFTFGGGFEQQQHYTASSHHLERAWTIPNAWVKRGTTWACLLYQLADFFTKTFIYPFRITRWVGCLLNGGYIPARDSSLARYYHSIRL